MSLLEGRHRLQVQTARRGGTSKYGNAQITYKDPVEVSGNVQAVSSEEIASLGMQTKSVYRVLARSWPGGPYSRIFWEGKMFEQRGEARWFTRSAATYHCEVLMVAAGVEIK